MTDARYVRVVMPIGSDSRAPQKQIAISEGAKRAGFEVRFPVYLQLTPDRQLAWLISEFTRANAIIADVSRERPSCYYELGVAEAIGKRVHLIAETGTPIHQSAAGARVSYYSNLDDLTDVVESALKKSR